MKNVDIAYMSSMIARYMNEENNSMRFHRDEFVKERLKELDFRQTAFYTNVDLNEGFTEIFLQDKSLVIDHYPFQTTLTRRGNLKDEMIFRIECIGDLNALYNITGAVGILNRTKYSWMRSEFKPKEVAGEFYQRLLQNICLDLECLPEPTL